MFCSARINASLPRNTGRLARPPKRQHCHSTEKALQQRYSSSDFLFGDGAGPRSTVSGAGQGRFMLRPIGPGHRNVLIVTPVCQCVPIVVDCTLLLCSYTKASLRTKIGLHGPCLVCRHTESQDRPVYYKPGCLVTFISQYRGKLISKMSNSSFKCKYVVVLPREAMTKLRKPKYMKVTHQDATHAV